MIRSLAIVSVIAIRTCNAIPCIQSYTDAAIDYISNNINIDPSIYYLGNKESTNECQTSCIDFNYLCNATSNTLAEDVDYWHFNHTECSVTALGSSDTACSDLLLTSDLVSKEYIIEAQLSSSSGLESGISFKSDATHIVGMDFYYYYYGINPHANNMITGYDFDVASYRTLSSKSPSNGVRYNTIYNVSVHVIDNTFTTYLDGEEVFTTSNRDQTDDEVFTHNYAGIYEWRSDVTFYSFKVRFPNANDNADERTCSAFIFDKMDGNCYGYYGDDYATIEASVSTHSQNTYDCGILYHSTCPDTHHVFDTTVSQQPNTTDLPFDTTKQRPNTTDQTFDSTEATVSQRSISNTTTSNVITEIAHIPPLYTTTFLFGATETDITVAQNTKIVYTKYTYIVVVFAILVPITLISILFTYILYKYFGMQKDCEQQRNIAAIVGPSPSALRIVKVDIAKIVSLSDICISGKSAAIEAHTPRNNIKEDEFVVEGDGEWCMR